MNCLRTALLTTLLSIATAAPATATTLQPAGANTARYQAWINASLVPLPDWRLDVYGDDCPSPTNEGACTGPGLSGIWLPPGTRGNRRYLMHEMGHQYDYHLRRDNEFRASFLRIIGRPHAAWSTEADAATDPNEQFAEAFALCSIYGTEPPAPTRVVAAFEYLYFDLRHERAACKLILRGASALQIQEPDHQL